MTEDASPLHPLTLLPHLLHVLLLLLSTLTPSALAQIAPACPSSLAFMNNDLNQSPCQVLSTLFGTCTGEIPFNLTALGTAFAGYAGPTSTDSSQFEYNQCLCSMPIYGLVCGCEDCQGKSPVSWVDWTASCNSSFTGSNQFPALNFPQTVPANTKIPNWVEFRLPFLGAGEAERSGQANINFFNQTWSEATVFSNVSAVALSSASVASQTAPVPTSSGGSGGGVQTGAVVGGVIGGVAVVALTGFGALFMRRHYTSRQYPASSRGLETGTPMTDRSPAAGGGFFGPPGGPYQPQRQHHPQMSTAYGATTAGSYADRDRGRFDSSATGSSPPQAASAAYGQTPYAGSQHSYSYSQSQSHGYGAQTPQSLAPTRTRSTSVSTAAGANPFLGPGERAPPVPEIQSDDTWNELPDKYASFHQARPSG